MWHWIPDPLKSFFMAKHDFPAFSLSRPSLLLPHEMRWFGRENILWLSILHKLAYFKGCYHCMWLGTSNAVNPHNGKCKTSRNSTQFERIECKNTHIFDSMIYFLINNRMQISQITNIITESPCHKFWSGRSGAPLSNIFGCQVYRKRSSID